MNPIPVAGSSSGSSSGLEDVAASIAGEPVALTDEKIDSILDYQHRSATRLGITNGGMVGETWNRIAARAIEAHVRQAFRDAAPITRDVAALLSWFARGGNPKWLAGHAAELAFYIATGGKLAEIDLYALTMGAWREGIEAPESDRAIYQRIKARATTEPSPETKL